MSERREGGYRKRHELMKRWKAVLAVFLSIVLVMQSSNIQAFAEVLTEGSSERLEQVVMDETAENEGSGEQSETQIETPPVSETPEPQVNEQVTEPVETEEQVKTETPAEPVETTPAETPAEPAETPAPADNTATQPTNEPAPVVEDTTATLSFDVTGATLTYNKDGEKSVTAATADKTVELDSTLDFKFTVSPDDGQQIASVKAVTSDGAESDVTANESGEYTLPAADVTDGTTIKVTTEAVPEPETPAEEETTEDADSVDSATDSTSDAAANTAMLLNTNLQLPVTIRYYDVQNNVTNTEDTTITSGVLEDMAPEKDGYYYLDATISTDNVPIAYAEMHDDGNVYYALEKDALTGILLEDSETIYLNYKELGNSVRVRYTTSGEDRVDGNEVIGFPETAAKGEAFSFQVALARGYEAVVSVGNQIIAPSAEASGVNTYSVTVNEESTVNVEFVKTQTVTFDPGVFSDSSYRYLYDNGVARFQFLNNSNRVQTQNIGDDGADFTFTFRTTGGSGWQCNSLQINGVYLNVPHTRTQGASATTTLYSDAYGECIATLRVTSVQNREATYELRITGAKEDLEITGANLRGGGWSEVIPTADEGINFESSPYGSNFEEGGLNEPFATDTGNAEGNTPAFRFSLQNGYKNLGVHVYGYDSDSEEVFNQVVNLPSAGRPENITVEYKQGNWWGGSSTKTTTVATITNNGNGVYTIKYTNNSVYGDALQLQFVEITCEKATYGVKYDLGAGTGQISDSNTYDVVDNTTAVVTNRMPEAPEGQIFLGWKIKGNESGPSYAVGDALDFTNDDIFRYVGNGDGERDGYLTLVATYTDEIAYGSSRPVNVKYFFENEDGEFVEDEEMRTTVQGVAGKQLSMLQHENTLEHDGYEYTFDVDASKTTIEVTGDNAIELRYALGRVDYTYNAGGGGSVDPTNERVIAQKEGAAKGSVAMANDGYKFDGWYVNDGGKDVKITEDNADDYNVKLTDNGTKLVPQRHNGKYEGGTFTAKFEQKQGIFRYNLVLDGAVWDANGAPAGFTRDGNFWNDGKKHSEGDLITVTDKKPVAEGYVFLGWFDKERDSLSQEAQIRDAGSTFTYPEGFEPTDDGKLHQYSLDALWASIDVQPKTVTYNGQEHAIDAATVEYNNNGLQPGDLDDVQRLVSVESIEYSKNQDSGYSETIPTWKDAGTYDVYVKATLKVGNQRVEVSAATKARGRRHRGVRHQALRRVRADQRRLVRGRADRGRRDARPDRPGGRGRDRERHRDRHHHLPRHGPQRRLRRGLRRGRQRRQLHRLLRARHARDHRPRRRGQREVRDHRDRP